MRISSINNFQYKPVYNRQTARKETAKPASMVSKPSFGGIYDDIVANKIDYMNNPQEHEVDKQLGHEIEKLTESIEKLEARIDNPKYANKKKSLTDKLEKYKLLKDEYVNKLVMRHLPFALCFVNQSNFYNVTFDDLYSYAVGGLKLAAERYAPSKYPDLHFITYARYWMKMNMSREVLKDQPISIAVGTLGKYCKVLNVKRELTSKLGRKPTSNEIAEELNIPVEKLINFMMRTKYSLVELDEPIKDGEGAIYNPANWIPDAYDTELMENSLIQEDLAYIKKLIDENNILDDRERAIIKDRYRFTDGKNGETVKLKSLDVLSKKHNLTRERIRQIEVEAIQKLKKAYNAQKLD